MSEITRDQLTKSVQEAINARLQKHAGITKIDNERCVLIYQDIFLAIQEIIVQVPALHEKIQDDGINYISQAYYDMLELRSADGSLIELNPNIFSKRIHARDLSTDELSFCGILLWGTPIVKEIVATIKSRQ